MDKIAIISDVHGNITALKAVINDIESRNISKIFCLGDSIYRGCNSDLVIDLLRKKCEIILKGNCDESLTRPNVPKGKYWTRDLIGEERANFILNLPVFHEFYMSGHFIRLFHASPFSLQHIYNPTFSNKGTVYSGVELANAGQLFENTEFLGKTENDKVPDVIGYGHIHTPCLIRYKNKTVFNPGSVGSSVEMLNSNLNDESNKFSTMASYIIIEGNYQSKDFAEISFNIVRIPYNIEKEIEDLMASDMPNKDISIRTLKAALPTNYDMN